MATQAMSDPMHADVMKGSKVLEINPGHPLIKTLNNLVKQDPAGKAGKAIAVLMDHSDLLESRFDPSDPKGLSQTLHGIIGTAEGINEEIQHKIQDPDLTELKQETNEGKTQETSDSSRGQI